MQIMQSIPVAIDPYKMKMAVKSCVFLIYPVYLKTICFNKHTVLDNHIICPSKLQ